MKESTSRVALGIEALFICLPLTFFFLFTTFPSLFYIFQHELESEDFARAGVSTLIFGCLLCGWRLIAAFLLSGVQALSKLRVIWWVLPIFGAAMALAVIARMFMTTAIVPSVGQAFGWGVPLLVPFLHLCAERLGRAQAKTNPGS